MADPKSPDVLAPGSYREPLLPATTEYATISALRSVIVGLDAGTFYDAAILVERMLWNPRLRGVVETRLNGLISCDIRWEPAKNNRDARRVAEAMAIDWPLIASAPVRKQMAKWCLFLGFGIGQRIATDAPGSGRILPRFRPYWPGWAQWWTYDRAYRVQAETDARRIQFQTVESPQLAGYADPSASPWVIAEPFGVNSWREGLLHAAWYPWFGHDRAMRDSFRNAEKNGIGIIKAKYPRGSNERGSDGSAQGKHESAVGKFTRGLRTMGSEGVVPLEQRDDGAASFNIEPFEFNGQGSQAIDSAMNMAAVSLAILFLGHNLTTEIKGGSYAAAGVADYIRDDVKNADAAMEIAWAVPQLAEVWTRWNYGDPELTPRCVPVTDSPAVNQATATTYQQLGQFVTALRQYAPWADVPALLERFRVPLLADGKMMMPVAAGGSNSQPNDTGEQENDSAGPGAAPDEPKNAADDGAEDSAEPADGEA